MAKIIYLISVLRNIQRVLCLVPIIMVFGVPVLMIVVELYNDSVEFGEEINGFIEVKKN